MVSEELGYDERSPSNAERGAYDRTRGGFRT